MMPRNPIRRKYRPILESLESKQLLSAGLPTRGLEIRVQGHGPMASQVGSQPIQPCGTGTSIRIMTS
jgi:hypothetical protein